MKFNNFLFYLLILPLIYCRPQSRNNYYVSPTPDIPSIHPEDNWMYGGLSDGLPEEISPSITTEYQEMLAKPSKKLITLGLNNSGLIDLNSTVVLDNTGRYIYENDGIQGTLAPLSKPAKKLPLTDQYEEMLKDKEKKMISLGINTTAYYDPESQVIIEGTQKTNPYDAMGRNFQEIENESKKTKRKIANFIENSPRFVEKNENSNDSNMHSFILEKYSKIMNFLEVYGQKESHSEDENRLYNKIQKYDELLQKMSYQNKYPSDKEYIKALSQKLNEIKNPQRIEQLGYRFNNVNHKTLNEKSMESQESHENSDLEPELSESIQSEKSSEALKTTKNHLKQKKITKKNSLENKVNNKNEENLEKSEKSLEKEITNFLPNLENEPKQTNFEQNNELSLNYRLDKAKVSEEIAKITNLVKDGEKDQEEASKLLSIFKSLLKNKKNKEISKNQAIFKEIHSQLKKINEDASKKDSKILLHDLKRTKKFVSKRKIDKNFREKFEEMAQNIVEASDYDKDPEKIRKMSSKLQEITELEQTKIENKNSEYESLAKEIENTENNVENGKLYEAEENLMEINDLLKHKNPKK